jgi:hypothetical protein
MQEGRRLPLTRLPAALSLMTMTDCSRIEMKTLVAIAAVMCLLAAHETAAAKEPTFPHVAEGTLPPNLRIIATKQALPDGNYALTGAPAMCLSRLSVVVDAAGGTDLIKMYLTDATTLSVSFQSRIDSEIRFRCARNDGSVPDRHLYNVNFHVKPSDPTEFQDVFHRVAVALYGWDTRVLDKAFTACADRAKRDLQKDRFGVIPKYGSAKGLECYLSSKEPHVTLFAPDVD